MAPMRRLLPLACFAALLAPASAAASGSGEDAAISGRAVLERGELVYTDYLYDAFGPDLDDQGNPPPYPAAATALTSGDYRYPDDPRYANDGADLREVQMKLNRRGLRIRVSLQAMADPAVPIATVAIDADGRRSTGAGVWPGGAGMTTPGAELIVTGTHYGAELVDARGRVRRITGAGSVSELNQLRFTVPEEVLGELDRRAQVWAGVGLAAEGGTGYLQQAPGATAVWDLAFQGTETYERLSSWSEQRQAAALASGDLAGFAGRLNGPAMRSGRTASPPLRPGFYNAVFRSRDDYGQGVDLRDPQFGTPSPEFLGRHQPYGLLVPEGWKPDERSPLLLALHSLERNHNQYASVSPGLLEELGDERDSLILTPLARGVDTWYLDSGLADTLEAWADVRRSFRVDRDRTSLYGYSMGGYGTFRLGLLMPDRFARAATYVGPPAYAYWTPPVLYTPQPEWRPAATTNPLVPNALNLPYEMTVAGEDELVAPAGTKAQAASFAEAGNAYRFYFHPEATHLTFWADDTWEHTQRWLGDHRRVVNPPRVRYVRIPAYDLPARGLAFDGAYWVDGIELRDASAGTGSVDATSLALAERRTSLVDEGTTELSAGGGVSTAATVTGAHLRSGARRQASNRFAATLTNVGSVELDVERMGLSLARTVRGTLNGDGVTRLRFSARGADVAATLDGKAVPVRGGRSGVAVKVDLSEPGPHRLTLRPRR